MSDLAKTYERCRHFSGIQNPCGAGVPLDSVKDKTSGPYRWPCVQLIGRPVCTTTCEKRELMTEAEHAAEVVEIEAAVAAAESAIRSGKCHECGAAIEPSRVIGRCKYAACGHRLGQVSDGEDEP